MKKELSENAATTKLRRPQPKHSKADPSGSQFRSNLRYLPAPDSPQYLRILASLKSTRPHTMNSIYRHRNRDMMARKQKQRQAAARRREDD